METLKKHSDLFPHSEDRARQVIDSALARPADQILQKGVSTFGHDQVDGLDALAPQVVEDVDVRSSRSEAL
jgi:hypothetical protein